MTRSKFRLIRTLGLAAGVGCVAMGVATGVAPSWAMEVQRVPLPASLLASVQQHGLQKRMEAAQKATQKATQTAARAPGESKAATAQLEVPEDHVISCFRAEVALADTPQAAPEPAPQAAPHPVLIVEPATPAAPGARPVVQIALLLDTSGSMDGLIHQARAHLWNVINQFATAKQGGVRPDLRVALYEYGNDSLPAAEGYIRQIVPFTDDLDKVSQELFALKTNGGSEFCGQVIRHAATTLDWSKGKSDFKAIFIAGNEEFTQGPVNYTEACKEAITRGIVVNTIHCGDEQSGVNGKWRDGATLADGSFVCINQNKTVIAINAPQDQAIAKLNSELNDTYVGYGDEGQKGKDRQVAQDAAAEAAAPGASQLRAAAKAGGYYSNASWDLVDAVRDQRVKLEDLKPEQLPEPVRKLSVEDRRKYVEGLGAKRAKVQDELKKLAAEREQYVQAERAKLAKEKGEKSLDEAIVDTIKAQAQKKGYVFEKPEAASTK